ncbi:hypothetical protein [Helicobacter cinaedi]|nr:hypothetical protein [Helicobacter cinaedi]
MENTISYISLFFVFWWHSSYIGKFLFCNATKDISKPYRST